MAGKCTTGLKRMCSAAFSASYNYQLTIVLYILIFVAVKVFIMSHKPPSEMTFPPPSSRAYLSRPFSLFIVFFQKNRCRKNIK